MWITLNSTAMKRIIKYPFYNSYNEGFYGYLTLRYIKDQTHSRRKVHWGAKEMVYYHDNHLKDGINK